MSHNETTIGTLLKQGREQDAADKLITVLERAKGNTVHAALACGVHHATLKRWLSRLADNGWDVRDHLDRIRRTTNSVPMSARERKRREEQVRVRRERDRIFSWFRRATEAELQQVAKESRCPLAIVRRLAASTPTEAEGSKVWPAVKRLAESRRAEWRSKRKTRPNEN